MFVCNKETYGYFPVPMPSHATLQDERESFLHTQLEIMGEWRSQRAVRRARDNFCLSSVDLAGETQAVCDVSSGDKSGGWLSCRTNLPRFNLVRSKSFRWLSLNTEAPRSELRDFVCSSGSKCHTLPTRCFDIIFGCFPACMCECVSCVCLLAPHI